MTFILFFLIRPVVLLSHPLCFSSCHTCLWWPVHCALHKHRQFFFWKVKSTDVTTLHSGLKLYAIVRNILFLFSLFWMMIITSLCSYSTQTHRQAVISERCKSLGIGTHAQTCLCCQLYVEVGRESTLRQFNHLELSVPMLANIWHMRKSYKKTKQV